MSTNNQRVTQLQGLIKLILISGLALIIGFWLWLSFGDAPENSQNHVRVDLASMAPGDTQRILWEGREVLVLYRTNSQFSRLAGISAPPLDLHDPESKLSRQPKSANNLWRSIDKNYFVAINLTPNTGCGLKLEDHFLVGICDGVKYDLAGRVLAGQSSKRNLEVPLYNINNEKLLVLEKM